MKRRVNLQHHMALLAMHLALLVFKCRHKFIRQPYQPGTGLITKEREIYSRISSDTRSIRSSCWAILKLGKKKLFFFRIIHAGSYFHRSFFFSFLPPLFTVQYFMQLYSLYENHAIIVPGVRLWLDYGVRRRGLPFMVMNCGLYTVIFTSHSLIISLLLF